MQQIQLELEGGGTLTVCLRASLDAMPAVKQRPLVLVVPGGGYNHVSPREGDPVALQFAAAGYHTAVLTYSVGEGARDYRPLRQLSEALGLLRRHAEEWHILPDKIAVCGFSAGGHLAASTAILWDAEPVQTALGIHGTEARPDAVVLGYPVITAGKYRHDGSIVNLCGDDADLRATMSLENQVRDGLPPFFVWHTVEDPAVPVQNSLMLAGALTAHKVPLELHLFAHDGHGTSTCTREVNTPNKHNSAWVALCTDWLAETFDFHL